MPYLSRSYTHQSLKRITQPGRHWDPTSTVGLLLFVKKLPSGTISRTWRQKVTVDGEGAPTELGLGRFPQVRIKDAKDKADFNATLAARGINPKNHLASIPTIESYTTSYIINHTTRPEDRKQYRLNAFATHVFPHIGASPIEGVRPKNLSFFKQLYKDKPTLGPMLLKDLENAFLQYADDNELDHFRSPISPAFKRQLPQRSKKVEHQPALSHSRLADLMQKIDNSTRYDISARECLKTIALNGIRSHSARLAEWCEVQCATISADVEWEDIAWQPVDWDNLDLDDDKFYVWFIPEDHMKRSLPFSVPVAHQQMEIFKKMWDEVRSLPGRNPIYIFPGRQSGRAVCTTSIQNLMDSFNFKSDCPGRNATIHGLRTTFREWARKRGVPDDVAEAALSHDIGNATFVSYMRWDLLEPRRILMQAYADYISGILPEDWEWLSPNAARKLAEANRRADEAERMVAFLQAQLSELNAKIDENTALLQELTMRQVPSDSPRIVYVHSAEETHNATQSRGKAPVTISSDDLDAMGAGPGDRLELIETPDGYMLRPRSID